MEHRPEKSPEERLAELCITARGQMARGGQLLHDEAGPLLSAAGLKLALLREDHPAAELHGVIELLDQAMEHIRDLSQQLNPSPAARTGLKHALVRLAESEPTITISYTATAKPPAAIVAVLYETVEAAGRAAIQARATRIRVSVTGTAGIAIRITDNGRKTGRARALAVNTLLARAAAISLDITTKDATIVSIRYALRRSIGR